MRIARNALSGVLVVYAPCAVLSAAAGATSLQWKINGKVLAAGETANAKFVADPYFISWRGFGAPFTIVCKNASFSEQLKGGKPGTDEIKAGGVSLQECEAGLEPPGCKVSGGTVAAEGLPWKTKLELFLGQKLDIIESAKIKFTFTGCTTMRFNGTYTITGVRLAGVLIAAAVGSRIEITFPNALVEEEGLGDELSIESSEGPGSEVVLAGEGEVSLENCRTIEVVEE